MLLKNIIDIESSEFEPDSRFVFSNIFSRLLITDRLLLEIEVQTYQQIK